MNLSDKKCKNCERNEKLVDGWCKHCIEVFCDESQSLSDKIFQADDPFMRVIEVGNVKQFIKELKKAINIKAYHDLIDKLAGEGLI